MELLDSPIDLFFHHNAHRCLSRKVTPEQKFTGLLRLRVARICECCQAFLHPITKRHAKAICSTSRLGSPIHAVRGRLRVAHCIERPWAPKSAVSGHSRRDTLRQCRCIVPKERKPVESLSSSSPCNELLMLSSPITKATPYTILHKKHLLSLPVDGPPGAFSMQESLERPTTI